MFCTLICGEKMTIDPFWLYVYLYILGNTYASVYMYVTCIYMYTGI